MAKIAIVYWSGSGNTEAMAQAVEEGAKAAGAETELSFVSDTSASDVAAFDHIILGCPAMGNEELEEYEFEPFFEELLPQLGGKVVAIFGMGDSSSYSDAYCNAMGELYEKFVAKGAKIVGAVATDGYEFDDSNAVKDGKFVGLALDNDNQSDLTQSRIEAWVGQIKSELA